MVNERLCSDLVFNLKTSKDHVKEVLHILRKRTLRIQPKKAILLRFHDGGKNMFKNRSKANRVFYFPSNVVKIFSHLSKILMNVEIKHLFHSKAYRPVLVTFHASCSLALI